MTELEILFLLLGWVAIFSLIIVVPWIVVRIMVGVLEADTKTIIDQWTPSVPEPEREQTEDSPTGLGDDDHQSVHPEHATKDR